MSSYGYEEGIVKSGSLRRECRASGARDARRQPHRNGPDVMPDLNRKNASNYTDQPPTGGDPRGVALVDGGEAVSGPDVAPRRASASKCWA
jgi:hypothetical protein